MQYRLRDCTRQGTPRFALVTDQPELLPQHAPGVRRRLQRVLAAREVAVHRGSGAVAVEPCALRLASGRSVAADRIVWATSAAAQPWLAASGLACDSKGFVSVDRHLRSTSHPFVFAAGDCATQIAYPRPKSGVFAVRQGPPLATNLRRTVNDAPLAAYVPQRHALALISTGGKHAIATRGRWTLEGDWVWRWKDRIDRRFVARYAPPSGNGLPVPAPLSRRT
jgi:selenide,water dikinase